jgi:ABC-2 type transport system permease protein
VGDEKARPLSRAYQQIAEQRYEAAGWVALLSPATLFKRTLTRWADTDAKAAWQYERDIRTFHAELREFYYPFLFNGTEYKEGSLAQRPAFQPNKTDK